MAQRTLAGSNQGERLDKRLLQIANNILTPRDARTKANFWKSEVVIYDDWLFDSEGKFNKKGWPRNLSFMPFIEGWEKIKAQIKTELETAKTTPCFVLSSNNNIMTFVLHPLDWREGKAYGVDYLRPDIVLFFKGGKQNTWKNHALLYRIIGYQYIDTRKLTLVITAKKDYCWQYHSNVLSAPAKARVLRSQLIRYYKDGEDWREYPDVCFSVCGDLRRPKYLPEIKEDSGIPKKSPGTPVESAEWQPKFKLMYTDICLKKEGQDQNRAQDARISFTPEGCHVDGCDGTGTNCSECPKMPQMLFIKRVNREVDEKTLKNSTDLHFFLYPEQLQAFPSGVGYPTYHLDKKGKGGGWILSDYSHAWNSWLPEPFNEQPHLIASEHSSVQFYFMRKLVNTSTLNQCRITYKKEDGQLEKTLGCQVKGKKKKDPYGKAKHVLQYKVFTKASTAGICYHFETGSQWFRVELKMTGFCAAKNYFWDTLQAVSSKMNDWVQENLTTDNQFESGGGPLGGLVGKIGKFFRFVVSGLIATAPGWIGQYVKVLKTDPANFLKNEGLALKKKPGETPITQTGSDAKDKGGGSKATGGEAQQETVELASGRIITKESYEREVKEATKKHGENEKSKLNWDTLGNTIQRATSFANTINIDYDPGEFFNRSQQNPFEMRYEFSEQLKDALYNNNNLAVAQELDNRISCLNNLINPDLGTQEVQADVDLFYDGEIGITYKNAFARGITFFPIDDSFEKDFATLSLRHSNTASMALDLKSSDPGLEGGLVDIEGETKGKKGKPVGAKDGTLTEQTAVWVYDSSYITKISELVSGTLASLEAGKRRFAEYMDKLPDDWFKPHCSGCNSPNKKTGSHWNFKENLTKSEITFPIEKGIYSYWACGYDSSDPAQTEEEVDKVVFWLEGGEGTTVSQSGGSRSGKWGKLCMRMDGAGGKQKININNEVIPPMVPKSDDKLPDGSTVGGRPNPTGGGAMVDTTSNIDEMGFSMEDATSGGMDFTMDTDLTSEINISDEEVNQMTQDIFESTTDNLEDYQEEQQVQQQTEVDENVDNVQNNNETTEQNENNETL